jgi:hypothetical protein
MVTSAVAELPELSAGVLIKQIRDTFDHLLGARAATTSVTRVADAALSAFAVFFRPESVVPRLPGADAEGARA